MAVLEQLSLLKVKKAEDGGNDVSGMSLESMVLLITTDRVNHLEGNIRTEYETLRARQEDVRFLHALLKAVNAATDENGEFDWSDEPELLEMLEKAREMGVDIPEGKTKFSAEDRLRLVENIKVTVEDLNLQNELQLQTITRLTNERYEMYQLARAIMRPLHETKMDIARKLAGR